MTASCFSTPLAVGRVLERRAPLLASLPVARPRIRRRQLVLPAVVALLLGAALLAPEQPAAQAEICERHNGVAACRIW
jgi:hypothetical protein